MEQFWETGENYSNFGEEVGENYILKLCML